MIPLALVLSLLLPALPAQDAPIRVLDPRSELDWTPWISDVPGTDLSGSWVFDARRSDPMLAQWRDRQVVYEISQQLDRIVFRFLPEGSEPVVQSFAWTGRVTARSQDGTEINERARWTSGGRVFEVEGRWWFTTDTEAVRTYNYRYELAGQDRLTVTQTDEFGTTVWHFDRRR